MAPYGVCSACIADQHEHCSNNNEPDSCGCLCRHRDGSDDSDDSSNAQPSEHSHNPEHGNPDHTPQ